MIVPQSIRSAAARRPSRVSAGLRMRVERGQVVRIRVPGADRVSEERMVLVLRLDQHQQSRFAEVMLVHPHVELAANSDLIVSSEHSTLPYRIVAQASSVGVVWTHQLGALVGKLDEEALEALGDVAVGQRFEREGLTTGPPLRGRFDPRWDFKAREGDTIRALAADCTAALLYDGPPLQLDPAALAPPLLSTCHDADTTIYKLVTLVTDYNIEFNLDDIQTLNNVGALEISNWTEAFGPSGHELFESLWLLVERALSVVDLPQDLVAEEPIDEWTLYRKADAGICRRRSGHHGISASYVYEHDRTATIQHANEHGFQLIDA